MAVLTRRQREIYEYIRDFVDEAGYSPSLEEIGEKFGLTSVATVHRHVELLVEKGYVRKVANSSRSLEPMDERPTAPAMVSLPVLHRRGAKVILEPANPAYRPLELPASEVEIHGVVRGLLRSY